MNDLIRREDAIDYFVTNIGFVDADGYTVDDYDERLSIWTERFSCIPSAEPEQRKGKWMIHSNYLDRLICSECTGQFNVWHWESKQMNFCPNCGADMRGK